MLSAKYKGEIARKVRSYFADRILRLLYFLKKNRYGQRRIIMDYKIWIDMVVLSEKSEYAIAHLHCSLRTIYICLFQILLFLLLESRFLETEKQANESFPKRKSFTAFSPLHSHQKALPFGNLRRATLPFLILRQQDSVFLDYLPDGQPSGLLLAYLIKIIIFIDFPNLYVI